MNVMCDAKMIF